MGKDSFLQSDLAEFRDKRDLKDSVKIVFLSQCVRFFAKYVSCWKTH